MISCGAAKLENVQNIQASIRHIKDNNLKPLIDLSSLEDGELRTMVYHDKLKEAIESEKRIHAGEILVADDITSLFN